MSLVLHTLYQANFTAIALARQSVPEECGLMDHININGTYDTSSSKQCTAKAWWRHQMGTFSALLAICAGNSPVTGEFHAQRPVTRRFDVFFDLRLNKRLSKQSWRRRAHCDVVVMRTCMSYWILFASSWAPYGPRLHIKTVFSGMGFPC